MARTEVEPSVSSRTFPRHHADPSQSGGLPGEKDSLKDREIRWRCLSRRPRPRLQGSGRVVAGDVDGHPHPVLDLLDEGLGQSRLSDLLEDPLDTGAPLLHDPGLTKDAGERRIALDGHAVGDLLNGHAGHEPAGALDNDGPVVEDHLDGGAAVGVPGVDEGVDDQFVEGYSAGV